jgi:hypothetical protein
MRFAQASTLRIARWIAVLVVLLGYVNVALGWVPLPDRLALAFAFALGPVAVIGVLGVSERLATGFAPRIVRAGSVFLVTAFALLTLMLAVQQAILAEYARLRGGLPSADVPTALADAFALTSQVQLGADVAFDVFYSVGIAVTSTALLGGSGLARMAGAYGLLVGCGLLALNIWTFPVPPSSAGVVDLGPATIVWWIGVIFLARGLDRGIPGPDH